jgi:hypothetical protein
VSTRTPVKFGTILDGLVTARLSHYSPAFLEVSNQFLHYGYKKALSGAYEAYILFQASRNAGLVSAEVAVSRDGRYPVARNSDFPDFGLGGYRESVGSLIHGFPHAHAYHSAESLYSLLLGMVRDVEQAVNRLAEKVIPRIRDHYATWEPLYEEWVRLDRKATGQAGSRYPGLWGESAAFEKMDAMLRKGQFDRFMGPLKFRYRQPHVFNCHLYLFSRAMEFLDPPDERNAPPPLPSISEKIVSRYPAALDDPIPSLLGRVPQQDSIELTDAVGERTSEYAFLKSLAAVESLLKIDENGAPAIDTLAADPSIASNMALIDAPIYAQPEYDEAHDEEPEIASARLDPAATAAPQAPALEEEDPLEAFENWLKLS